MATIALHEQILPLTVILNKNINNITLRETISLIFHAIILIYNDEICEQWKELYDGFEKELHQQNDKTWPYISITTNNTVDIFLSESFIKSNNILMLLLRLLYIENKKKYINMVSENNINISIKKLSLNYLFDILKNQIKYYIKTYPDNKYVEYHLGNAILNLFD